jgi:hypothetical protein
MIYMDVHARALVWCVSRSLFPGIGPDGSLPKDPEDLPFDLAVAVNKFDLLPMQATRQRVQQWVRTRWGVGEGTHRDIRGGGTGEYLVGLPPPACLVFATSVDSLVDSDCQASFTGQAGHMWLMTHTAKAPELQVPLTMHSASCTSGSSCGQSPMSC